MQPDDETTIEELARGAERAAVALTAAEAEEEEELDQERWAWIDRFRGRGGRKALSIAVRWSRSPDAHMRRLAAEVLGQLQPSVELTPDCRAAVLPLLEDEDLSVLQAAIVALGHLDRLEEVWDPTPVLRFARHPADVVRDACCFALGGRPAESFPEALETLMGLAADPHDEIRDWAVFGFGVNCEIDSPEIREALARRLDDPSEDVRGEAIHGLALRGDERAADAIEAALATGTVASSVLQAVKVAPDRRFIDELRPYAEFAPDDTLVVEALRACEDCS